MTRYASMQARLLANSVSADVVGCRECYHGESFCWLWLGSLNNSGYPRLSVRFKRGPRKGKVHTVLAHRLSLREFRGFRVSTKSVAMHLCNNKRCINPMHLLPGSQRTNMQQCVREGRHCSPFRKKA